MQTKLRVACLAVIIVSLTALAIPRVRTSLIEHRDRAFTAAAWRGDVQRMRILRIVGADLRKSAPGNGPAIIAAGWTGKTDAIRYLLDNGADVNQRDKFGWTALVAAANEGHIEAVQYLISRDADVNAAGEDGSALHRAREKGHLQIAALLEARGARDRSGH